MPLNPVDTKRNPTVQPVAAPNGVSVFFLVARTPKAVATAVAMDMVENENGSMAMTMSTEGVVETIEGVNPPQYFAVR